MENQSEVVLKDMSKAAKEHDEFAFVRHHIAAAKAMGKTESAKYLGSLARAEPESFLMILAWALSNDENDRHATSRNMSF